MATHIYISGMTPYECQTQRERLAEYIDNSVHIVEEIGIASTSGTEMRTELLSLIDTASVGDRIIIENFLRIAGNLNEAVSAVCRIAEKGITVVFAEYRIEVDSVEYAHTLRDLLSLYLRVEKDFRGRRIMEGHAASRAVGRQNSQRNKKSKLNESRREIREALAAGNTIKETAAIIGVHYQLLYRYLRAHPELRKKKA